jgi:hypothetical protein
MPTLTARAGHPPISHCIAAHKNIFFGKRRRGAIRISFTSHTLVSFLSEVPMKNILITTAMFSALAFTPASAKMMGCTGDNMAKTSMMMSTMADGPGKMGMGKEMGMANTEMSKGNMRGGCMHYMKAQTMSMMK